MDVRRISLIAGLAVVTYLMILQWSKDYTQTPPASAANSVITAEIGQSDIPKGNIISSEPQGAIVSEQNHQNVIQVTTDALNIQINLKGGDIVYAALPKYPDSLNTPDIPFRILETQERYYIAQSGLVGKDGIDKDSRAEYNSEAKSYELGDKETLEVVLNYQDENGLRIKKIYTFTKGSYLIDLRFEIKNQGLEAIETNLFAQLRRDGSSDPSTQSGLGMRSYLGATFSTDSSTYEKVKFSDLDDNAFSKTSQGGWVALLQHYFLSAWIPAANDSNSFYGQKGSTGNYYIGFQAPSVTVNPDSQITVGAQLYVGPKDQDVLGEIATNLEKTVDYGWLWFIAKWLFLLMEVIHSLIGNWGWSIILMTLTVKMLLMPLTAKSYKSMAKMRKFTPRIQELREQFGDDRQRMSQEMMKLYQKEKLNPLGGCLPMLLQMPIFIALYWVLKESVELRQSPFMFWIVDLSIKDPYFVLPLLMGASMFLQMQMQQQPAMDPMQAKMMKFMPVMFTFMFLWFPAGLTLYWFVNNVITIIQQYLVNRSIERAESKSAT